MVDPVQVRTDLATIGFRVVTNVPRAPKALVDAFKDCPTTDIADVVTKMFTMSSAIRPLYEPIKRIAGSAVTVRVPPGDNLMVHAALSYAGDGDVIVVDARGETEYCLGGALMGGIAQHNGVRGFVLDGAYRDGYELRKIGFPVFGRGLQPRPPRKLGPGEINTVIECGGVPVHPGDVVVADEEGVAVIPLEYAEAVLDKVRQRGRTDSSRWGDLTKWETEHRTNYEKLIKDLGCRMD
jgi:4-hydroxy-4-methyl-2-oxoglutarate aldolase